MRTALPDTTSGPLNRDMAFTRQERISDRLPFIQDEELLEIWHTTARSLQQLEITDFQTTWGLTESHRQEHKFVLLFTKQTISVTELICSAKTDETVPLLFRQFSLLRQIHHAAAKRYRYRKVPNITGLHPSATHILTWLSPHLDLNYPNTALETKPGNGAPYAERAILLSSMLRTAVLLHSLTLHTELNGKNPVISNITPYVKKAQEFLGSKFSLL